MQPSVGVVTLVPRTDTAASALLATCLCFAVTSVFLSRSPPTTATCSHHQEDARSHAVPATFGSAPGPSDAYGVTQVPPLSPRSWCNATPSSNVPFLYKSTFDTSSPGFGYPTSDLKNPYLSRQQLEARMISPTITMNDATGPVEPMDR